MIRFLSKFYPLFLHRLDERLLTTWPALWATRIHILLFYMLCMNGFFALVALLFSGSLQNLMRVEESVNWLSVLCCVIGMIWGFKAHVFDPRREFPVVSAGYESLRMTILLVGYLSIAMVPVTFGTVASLKQAALVENTLTYEQEQRSPRDYALNTGDPDYQIREMMADYKRFVDPQSTLTYEEVKRLFEANDERLHDLRRMTRHNEYIIIHAHRFINRLPLLLESVFLMILMVSGVMSIILTASSFFGNGQVIQFAIVTTLVSILFALTPAVSYSNRYAGYSLLGMGAAFFILGFFLVWSVWTGINQSKGILVLLNTGTVLIIYSLGLLMIGILMNEEYQHRINHDWNPRFTFHWIVAATTLLYFTLGPLLNRVYTRLYSLPQA